MISEVLEKYKVGLDDTFKAITEKGVSTSGMSILGIGEGVRSISGEGGGFLDTWLTENGYPELIQPTLVDYERSKAMNNDSSTTWDAFKGTSNVLATIPGSVIIDPKGFTIVQTSALDYNKHVMYIGENVNISGVNLTNYFRNTPRLVTFKPTDIPNATNTSNMFVFSGVHGKVKLNAPLVENADSMFSNCWNLEEIELLTNGQAISLSYTFQWSQKLKKINFGNVEVNATVITGLIQYSISLEEVLGTINISAITSTSNVFNTTPSLKEIRLKGLAISGLSFQQSPLLSVESMVYLFENAATVSGTYYIYLGTTNLAKLTDGQKAIATNKGWRLS